MPMSSSQCQAHEAPLLRVRLRHANGSLHQMTISSSFLGCAETAPEAWHAGLADAVHRMFRDTPLTVLRIEHLNTLSVEVN